MLHYAFYFILSIRPPSTAAAYRESYRPSFLSDPAEASVCAVRGSHDSEDKHGAKGKNIPNRKEAKMGNSQSSILSLRVLQCYPLHIRYIRILLIFATYNTGQRIRSSFVSFHLSLAGLTRERKWYLRSESPPGELIIYHLRSLLSCLIMLF